MPRNDATLNERITALSGNQARIALMKLSETLYVRMEHGMHESVVKADLIEALDIAESYEPTN